MTPNHWSQDFQVPELKFFDLKKTKSETEFKGKITIFDGFHTGKIISLNIVGQQQMCADSEKSIIIFKFSPKDYNHAIWNDLMQIIPIENSCD